MNTLGNVMFYGGLLLVAYFALRLAWLLIGAAPPRLPSFPYPSVSWPKPERQKVKKRETKIWIGDGMAPAGPHLIGQSYLDPEDGHTKTIVETTLLTVVVEWEE